MNTIFNINSFIELLPHGSGIDSDYSAEYNTIPSRNVGPTFTNYYHAMNEHGYYIGYIQITIEYRYVLNGGVMQFELENIATDDDDCKAVYTGYYDESENFIEDSEYWQSERDMLLDYLWDTFPHTVNFDELDHMYNSGYSCGICKKHYYSESQRNSCLQTHKIKVRG